MTVARQLAEFLTATSTADLPAQALDNAAMLIASTIASAACGTGLESARIIRGLARDRGGRRMRPCGSTPAPGCPSPMQRKRTP